MSKINYIQHGDYLLPDLTIQPTERPISRYGRMRRTYLQQKNPIMFNYLAATGKLFPHLLEIEDAANLRLEQIMTSLSQQEGVNEELKASNQMLWVQKMNAIKAQAEEIISAELLYQ